MIFAELVDGCNLKCALCWNRKRKASFKQMSLETVQQILDKFRHTGQEIAWFNWGEPLLHKQFIEVADMVAGTNSSISSNFSLPIKKEVFQSFSKFSKIHISLSGLTPEIYNIYHRGGDIEQVKFNIEILSRHKLPRVVLRWLQHPYNVGQEKEAIKYAEKLGMEFEPTRLNCEVEELISGNTEELEFKLMNMSAKNRHSYCRLLNWIPIDVDGDYTLCCASHNIKIGYHVADNVSKADFIAAKTKTEVCTQCRSKKYWRMF